MSSNIIGLFPKDLVASSERLYAQAVVIHRNDLDNNK